MRVAISGAASTGKSTLVNNFLFRWPMYTTPSKTYRDVIKENNLTHSSNTNEETQLMILDWMMQEHVKYPKGSKVVFDRCPWDNLAYTLQGNANGTISDEVTAATISFVRESMKNIDIIFWIPTTPQIKIVPDGLRDTNSDFIKGTNTIFNDLYEQYADALESDVFYPKEDCPAIIKLDGYTIDDRLWFVNQFIDDKGELIETETSILDPSNLDMLEAMLKEQQSLQAEDKKVQKIINQFRTFNL